MHEETAHEEHAHVVSRNARYGLVLFTIYVSLYAAFIGVATFNPGLLAAEAPGGANWAIAFGLGLIWAAFVLAAIYMVLCSRPHAGKGGAA